MNSNRQFQAGFGTGAALAAAPSPGHAAPASVDFAPTLPYAFMLLARSSFVLFPDAAHSKFKQKEPK
jgi:hypothetical protein